MPSRAKNRVRRALTQATASQSHTRRTPGRGPIRWRGPAAVAAPLIAAFVVVVAGTRGAFREQTTVQQHHLAPSHAWNYGTLAQLTHASTTVVLGRVTAHRSYHGTDGVIDTNYTINVQQTIAGAQSQATLALRVTGGTVGHTQDTVTGLPSLANGQHVVVFATRYAPNHYRLTGNPEALWLVNHGTVHSDDVHQLSSSLAAFQNASLRHFIAEIP